MSRMPGAVWKPLPASTARISQYDIVCIHTMVGSLAGTDAYFRRNAPGVNSHFGTGGGGEIWQWVDTAYRSGANLNGNWHIVSIENADMGPGFPVWNTGDASQVPAFTPRQLEANARICAWAHQAHGIPLELIPDARPGRRGIGYHRQGVPGYMVDGAERWSNAVGKVCPGSRRIAQIPQIIARAREIAGGAPVDSEDEMNADQEKKLDEVLNILSYGMVPHSGEGAYPGGGTNAKGELTHRIRQIHATVAALAARAPGSVDAEAIAAAIPPELARQVADELGKRIATRDLNTP